MKYILKEEETERPFFTLSGARKAKAEAEKKGRKASIYENNKK